MGAEWPSIPLGEVTENLDALRVPVTESDRKLGPYPYYGASGIVDHIDRFIFDGEYLLVAEDGENLRTRKTPAAFLARGKFWVNNHAHVVRGNHLAETRFLAYALQVADIGSYLTGTTMPKLNQGNLNRIPVPVPPIPEQRAIMEVLGAVDDKIDLNRRMNHTLEAIAQALFRSWFVDFESVRAKAEGRQPLGVDTEALFPATFEAHTEMELPSGWHLRPLYDLATWVNGAAYRDFQFCAAGEGLPVVRIAELKAGITGQTRRTNTNPGDRYLIDTGDVLFSWSGNPDTSIDTFVWVLGKAWLNQHIFKVITGSRAERTFVLCLLRHLRPVFAETARNKQTTGLGHVTAGDMKRLLVAYPSQAALESFGSLAGPVVDLMQAQAVENVSLAGLRDALLPRLLSGELRVRDAEAAIGASA
jgi:type I restriction enzyme, S subunit